MAVHGLLNDRQNKILVYVNINVLYTGYRLPKLNIAKPLAHHLILSLNRNFNTVKISKFAVIINDAVYLKNLLVRQEHVYHSMYAVNHE